MNGEHVLTADGIADTASWYATVDADRPNALGLHFLTIPTGEAVVVQAWPEDGPWAARVSDRLERGLPVLDKLIGLPWPVVGELLVTEVHTPLLEGYAGIYHPDTGGIEVSEELDDVTILHETSHAWFDGALFDGPLDQRGPRRHLRDEGARADRHRVGPAVRLPTLGAVCLRPRRLAAARPDHRRRGRPTRATTATRPRSASSSRS